MHGTTVKKKHLDQYFVKDIGEEKEQAWISSSRTYYNGDEDESSVFYCNFIQD